MKKTYVIDIDGTICTQEEDYSNAKPYKNRIERINKLYENGNEIVFFTARGTGTGIDWRKTTELQLKSWKIKYHSLIFGKPVGDIFIDDRALSDKILD